MDVDKEATEEVKKILKNAIGDILLYGCSSLPCEECPLFDCVENSSNDKLCEAIGGL